MSTHPHARQTLAHNVGLLMKLKGWNQSELARHAGVSQKTISNIVNVDSSIESVKLSNIEKIASAFGIDAWKLILPGMPADAMETNRLERIIQRYISMPEDAREIIDRIAEMESKYSANKSP